MIFCATFVRLTHPSFLMPPCLPALAVKVNFMLSFAQLSALISFSICQFPGVKAILGLTILRFLVLDMLTRTSKVPLGFFVRTTLAGCCSSPDVASLALEISFLFLNSIILHPSLLLLSWITGVIFIP